MFANDISPPGPKISAARWIWLCLCLAILSGCATTRSSVDLPDISTWELRQDVLGGFSDWAFRGRIAVKAGDEGFNGKLNWRQNGNHFTAAISGPLGMGTVLIEGTERGMVLTDKDGVKRALVDPETELYFRYGWTIPVASLRYWVMGIPDPGAAATTEVDAAGRLLGLEQGAWSVEISRYTKSAGQQMPRILTATNPDTRVRMVIDKWMFFER